MKQGLRIIGGQFRGKKLPVPEGEGLRPTPSRVRETLFNWLMHNLSGARCLDAFAGSGALGLEAFSRGASQVTFLERSPVAVANLQKILTAFNSPQLTLIPTDTCTYLQKTQAHFDVIFLDPPFASDLLQTCLKQIENSTILGQGGLLYWEAAEAIAFDQTKWQALKLKRAGQVVYGLMRYTTKMPSLLPLAGGAEGE